MAEYRRQTQGRSTGKTADLAQWSADLAQWSNQLSGSSAPSGPKLLRRAVLNWVLHATLLLLLLVSCGGTAPDIIELRWRLNLDFAPRLSDSLTDSNTVGQEALSVFIRPADEDGLEDLDSMYLINQEEDLFWALDSTQWKSVTSTRIFWIGSNQFSSGYLGRLPRGRYIVQLYDKSGEYNQRSFELQAPDTQELITKVTVPQAGDELLFLLPKDVSLYSIVGYNINDEVLFTDANYQSIISLKELKIRNDELEKVILQFEFPENNVMVHLGPYIVPRISSDREDLAASLDQPEGTAEQLPNGEVPSAQLPDQNSIEEPALPEDADKPPIDTYIPTPEEIEQSQ